MTYEASITCTKTQNQLMLTDFTSVMASQSDEELLQIVTTDRYKYTEEAIKAAELEVDKRCLKEKNLESPAKHKIEIVEEKNQFASFDKRFVARLIDCLIVTVGVFLFITIYNMNETEKYQIAYQTISNICFIIFYYIYYPLLEASGGTYGKRILKIQPVSKKTFEKISLATAYKRSLFLTWPFFLFIFISILFYNIERQPNLTYYFLIFLVIVFSIIAPVAAIWSKTKQGWHDAWTDTFVINKTKNDPTS